MVLGATKMERGLFLSPTFTGKFITPSQNHVLIDLCINTLCFRSLGNFRVNDPIIPCWVMFVNVAYLVVSTWYPKMTKITLFELVPSQYNLMLISQYLNCFELSVTKPRYYESPIFVGAPGSGCPISFIMVQV